MKEQLEAKIRERVNQYISPESATCDKTIRKHAQLQGRNGEIVKVSAIGKVENKQDMRAGILLDYKVHYKYLIKQNDRIYIEEEVENRQARFFRNKLVSDEEILPDYRGYENDEPFSEEDVRLAYTYDRLKAVQYAERWWDEYNPNYPDFENDCTSFISQCLHAGGVPMWGRPNRSKGWWMTGKSWSWSWSVANSLKTVLEQSKGIRTKVVDAPQKLLLGDVICYDFQGDGRFDHNTIVTGKDQAGMPLVNAHTTNSRQRYWAYEDSTAYTENIKYKFFSILDGQ